MNPERSQNEKFSVNLWSTIICCCVLNIEKGKTEFADPCWDLHNIIISSYLYTFAFVCKNVFLCKIKNVSEDQIAVGLLERNGIFLQRYVFIFGM